jgi:UDP-GlcNAc:undecaprenyl-phosphate GlcNAc-1-phosphate transferase
MGGIAMYVGFVAALVVSMLTPFFTEMRQGSPEPLAALVGCTLMLGLGAIDDKRGTTPLSKFTAQVFIGGVLILLGVQFAWVFWPGFGIVDVSGDLAVPLTILWIALVANAVNLADGLDGLAAGMVAIAAGTLFVYVVRADSVFGDASASALLAAITAGVCLGFLPWNWYPAKIFMGDSGSMLLGMMLAIATISGLGRNPYAPSAGDIAAIVGSMVVPLLVLFIPLLDVILAVARRTWRRQGIGHPDKEHIHHRLMDIGHGHRSAVLLMYLWSGLISLSVLAVGLINGRVVVGLILIGMAFLFLATALPRLSEGRRNGAATGRDVSPADEPARAGDQT